MMDSTNILSLLDVLEIEVDGLEDSLAPLIHDGLTHITSKLPLLDKAKLYVLMTYAIESILFSYLRLNGSKAREHPVFQELRRVKQYFEKIKTTEDAAPGRPNLSLDKDAAARFISAGLAGNSKFDLEEAERLAKEKAQAHLRAIKASSGSECMVANPQRDFRGKPQKPQKKRKAEVVRTGNHSKKDASDEISAHGASSLGSKKSKHRRGL